ncbi:COR domain-containing protein [Hymenobacter sp. GOD-10R]|uniref:leucine-rich repeat domain-containing protein n=1 Tax=Hymenobacter sp. GOD-10R TaxID=3093922 RepID=UPI002D77190C|nr:COR domain-containing protein [Hymenobacter sp. GOD-10R]WRQ28137.1 COR domain-containing protein [Hymenobacter sp. GOD-10R]
MDDDKVTELHIGSILKIEEFVEKYTPKTEDIITKILSLINNLKNLTVLDFSNNAWTGGLYLIPKAVSHLNLANNEIWDISSLENLTNLTHLNLSNNKISDIEKVVFITKIRYLNLSDNRIADVNPLANLKKLTYLNISKNWVKDFTRLADIKQLEHLDLSYNIITDNNDNIQFLFSLNKLSSLILNSCEIRNIPPIVYPNQLTRLSLSNNRMEDITWIKNINNLEYLEIDRNSIIDFLPISHLNKLTYLDLSSNNIENVDFIKSLTNITYLSLNDNAITDITPLTNLNNIRTMILTNNKIQEAPELLFDIVFKEKTPINTPDEIILIKSFFVKFQMYSEAAIIRDYELDLYKGIIDIHKSKHVYTLLHKFFLYKNPITSPPYQIITQGKEAIDTYFDQIHKEEGKTLLLFESKLLIIGEGGTGKTTFARRIQDVNAPLPKEKDTTLAIDIWKWKYRIDFRSLGKVVFNVNIWDFGGQRIYHGTHQMFFGEKSFYVLVAETREQNTNFSYWLNTIDQLGGDNSSLIIILNKKYGHEQKFDEVGYKSHFGSLIKEVIHLDLANDISSVIDLQEKVKFYMKQLPEIGDALPPSWVKIRNKLSDRIEHFISFDEFRYICKEYNIEDSKIINTLSSYFNRIGVITHYIDDLLLQERVYLNSNWLVKTVYEVLDNNIVKSKRGRLTEVDIRSIWKNNDLQYEVNKLTQLMHRFGLMYHIHDTENYVVPAHLPTITPYEDWAHTNENILQFVYEFDKYMPQGIMSRLIVALHHHIKDHNLVWHRGLNIEANGAYAEIIESYGGINRFEIRISGKNKIELLSIIRERFSEVIKPFRRLNYKQLIPCICSECKNSLTPSFHDYNVLLKFREKGIGSQCSITGDIVNVEEILKITQPKIQKNQYEYYQNILSIIFGASR